MNIDYVEYKKDGRVEVGYTGCGCCSSRDKFDSIEKAQDVLDEYFEDLLVELKEVAKNLQYELRVTVNK